ncbi:MAG: AMP-binding protein [Myxococcota bacterium]
MPNLAAIHEAIAAAVPDAECLVYGERRLRWRELTDRTRRLASVLRTAGLGCRRERAGLANHESGQDHVALYLYNGNEYLEGMLGAMKARCAPFNVNYRYVEEELVYLFDNADARAVIFHASFAPTLARIRDQLPGVRLWLCVDDGSGAKLDGALEYEAALAAAEPAIPQQLSEDDLYILYTGGTTGMPKGVLWRHDEILRAALLPPSTEPTLDAIVERARRGASRVRALPTPPFMHGAAHWAAFTMWHTGGTVFVQSKVRGFDAHDVLATVERERITALTIVGDAFARPLRDALRERSYDASSLQTITSGGAILTASVKDELLARLPQIRLIDVLGSSESGQQASQISRPGAKSPPATSCSPRISPACWPRAPANRAGSRAAAPCRSGTTRTPRSRRAPFPWWAACGTPCRATARSRSRAAGCACSAATRSRSTRAARRSSLKRSSMR